MAVLGTCVSWVTGRETNVCRIIAASKLVLRWDGTIDHPVGPSIITKILACGREMTVLAGMVLNLATGQHSEAGKDKTISRRNKVYDLDLQPSK